MTTMSTNNAEPLQSETSYQKQNYVLETTVHSEQDVKHITSTPI